MNRREAIAAVFGGTVGAVAASVGAAAIPCPAIDGADRDLEKILATVKEERLGDVQLHGNGGYCELELDINGEGLLEVHAMRAGDDPISTHWFRLDGIRQKFVVPFEPMSAFTVRMKGEGKFHLYNFELKPRYATPHLAEFHFTELERGYIPFDCEMCPANALPPDAGFHVFDRSTRVGRWVCAKCVRRFQRYPFRLTEACGLMHHTERHGDESAFEYLQRAETNPFSRVLRGLQPLA